MKRSQSGSKGLRFSFWLMGQAVLCTACSSDGTHQAPDDGVDEPSNSVSDRDAASGEQTRSPDAMVGAIDAATSSNAETSWSTADASVTTTTSNAPTGSNSFHAADAHVSEENPLDAGSLIIDPTVDTVDVPTLCDALWELQGQMIALNLAGQVSLGDWADVTDFAATTDAGLDASSSNGTADAATSSAATSSAATSSAATSDASACVDEFAPYVVQCAQGAIVLQSPSFVYTSGPALGGELVSMGCWQRQCASDCVPTSLEQLAQVQARVTPVFPMPAPEGGVQGATGLVRINGVELEAIATLEITGRLQ